MENNLELIEQTNSKFNIKVPKDTVKLDVFQHINWA